MNIRQSWCLSVLCLLLSANVFSQTKSVVSNADNLVTQWIALEKQNTQLKSEWQDTQQLLKQRIALLKLEQKQLTALTSNHSHQMDEVTQQRQKLLTLQTSMEQTQTHLSSWLNKEFAQIRNIHPQLPPPLANSWQTTLDDLNKENVSKRLEILLSLYQSFDEFNQRISTQQATITDENGQQKMVQQLFLGVARGWYLTLDGSKAVSGQPTASGWQWLHQQPVDAQQVKDALAMLAHKQEAKLITLPMMLASSVEQ